jgi:hypothetical protein
MVETSQRIIKAKTGTPHQRLYSWIQKWEKDPIWRPWNPKVHGAHHRVSTDAEEGEISDHVSDNYLVPGHLFTDTSFIEIATMAFLEQYHDKEAPS